jgi:Sybindin-like family
MPLLPRPVHIRTPATAAAVSYIPHCRKEFYLSILSHASDEHHTAGAVDGIEEIRAAGFLLHCLQTVTGIKFVLTAATTPDNEMAWSNTLKDVLKEIYILYTECVLKDPFYELEMPIRSELFLQAVDALIQRHAGGPIGGKPHTAPAKLLY